MKNSNGQALIEFIVILPIFLLILICLFDVGNVLYKKFQLENDMDIVINMYNAHDLDGIDAYILDKKIDVSYDTSNGVTDVTISRNVSSNTLFIDNIIGHTISVKRTVYDEG